MADPITQQGRKLELKTPLGQDVLLIRSFEGTEAISNPFRFKIEAQSTNKKIDVDSILSKGVTVRLEALVDGDPVARFFHGLVDRFGIQAVEKDNAIYRLEVVSWLAILDRTADCRIFQDKTVPEIVTAIFNEWKAEYPLLVKFEDKTNSSKYRALDYCVQYRETDFRFVSRLMEQEGIFYYFKPDDGEHVLVMGDDPSHHVPCPLRERVPFKGDEEEVFQGIEQSELISALEKGGDELKNKMGDVFKQAGDSIAKELGKAVAALGSLGGPIGSALGTLFNEIVDRLLGGLKKDLPSQEGIKLFRSQKEFRSGKYTMRDYHFRVPAQTLEVSEVTAIKAGDNDKLEIYDYPGGYAKLFNKPDRALEIDPEGRDVAALRMQEEETPALAETGISREGGLMTGHRFELIEHDHKPFNGKYILTAIQHSAVQDPPYRSDDEEAIKKRGGFYRNAFACIDESHRYRPPRTTPKATVAGPQTAEVVGPAGEEIFVDKFGRIRVQFHWDREGKKDEKSTCFLRVAQIWAGKRWGAFFWPRIGQEVVVAFLEGDPDQPIVIGSVYNAEQMPPYIGDGPDGKHPDDPRLSGIKTNSTMGGAGHNEIRFNDKSGEEQVFLRSQRDTDMRTLRDTRETVFGTRHLIVGLPPGGEGGEPLGDQKELVHQDKHLQVKRDHFEKIERDMQLLVKRNQDVAIDGGKHETIGGDLHLHVVGKRMEKIDGKQSLTVGGDQHEKVSGGHALDAGSEIHLKAGMKVIIEAGVQVSLKAGGSFVDIGPAGVAISGAMVLINSGGAAGSGGGSSPDPAENAQQAAPVDPDPSDESKTGFKSS